MQTLFEAYLKSRNGIALTTGAEFVEKAIVVKQCMASTIVVTTVHAIARGVDCRRVGTIEVIVDQERFEPIFTFFSFGSGNAMWCIQEQLFVFGHLWNSKNQFLCLRKVVRIFRSSRLN